MTTHTQHPAPDALPEDLRSTLARFTTQLTPRMLLGFFTDERSSVHVYKMECHPTGHGDFTVGAAQPGTAEDVEHLRSLVDTHAGTLLHEHVLMHTATQSVWWVPAGEQLLFFRSKTGKTESTLNALSGQTFPQPALLMIARRGTLFVYALKDNVRPTLDTPLYMAPYLNMFGNGTMCMGSVRLPERFDPGDPHAFTRRFFESHFNGANQLTWKGCTHPELWTEARELGHFNPDRLLPEPNLRTVRDALKLTHGGRA